ncbi:hypothetical protein [Streptomyces broussonetiae]|uniref:Uncharacterized protein n=1 Tax=Streptomyces broussonetiae TaxID=2686304 RepID=A0A6I6MQL9_9ACTN|nr:hypothetical protein [Streptomyces broussonetiae]QHA02778.1 hypothetical protein GQF42_05315 [Streptomyces broussonetiae]
MALLSAPAPAAVVRRCRPGPAEPHSFGTGARTELRAVGRPGPLVALGLAALVNGTAFCTFTHPAPPAAGVTGLGAGWVPGLSALFGAGSCAG